MNPAAFSALAKGDLANYMAAPLPDYMAASLPGGIEAQEKAGQDMVCKSELLPLDCGGNKHVFESLGFVFGDPVDRIFCKGTLPPGWSKKPTDHSMWSDFVDEKGRKRGAMFYKAAFYDQSAHMNLCPRFSIWAYDDAATNGFRQVSIKDGGVLIEKIGEYGDTDWSTKDELVDKAIAWLNERYPDWDSPVAYWD